ncbi:hypothetical protein L3Y34_011986 [Caenorhabditis briggsae]|uniref:Uncharacterized protein n=1 Tax=Caenorhabditis briggsae TaxID=6238 RepID=A0AAE8ZVW8_CAEBR|nr:hypothetical protein L3Y34_011986 [Caenorhabditis briggsae]
MWMIDRMPMHIAATEYVFKSVSKREELKNKNNAPARCLKRWTKEGDKKFFQDRHHLFFSLRDITSTISSNR